VIAGIVLAAGDGTRFGGIKQLARLDGRPLLQHALEAVEATEVSPVVVILGAAADEIVAEVDLRGATPVVCDRWAEGPAASLACGLSELPGCEAAVVTLGDQPRLAPEAIRRVISARGAQPAVRATYGGEPGHPVLLEHELFDRMRDVSGDHGARNLLRSLPVRTVECEDLGGGQDVDTTAQLEALQGTDGVVPILKREGQ